MLKILKNNTIINNIQDNSNELVTTEFSCKPSQVLMHQYSNNCFNEIDCKETANECTHC